MHQLLVVNQEGDSVQDQAVSHVEDAHNLVLENACLLLSSFLTSETTAQIKLTHHRSKAAKSVPRT